MLPTRTATDSKAETTAVPHEAFASMERLMWRPHAEPPLGGGASGLRTPAREAMANSLVTARSNALRHISRPDDTSRALLEFYLPSVGLVTTPVSTLARGLAVLMTGMMVVFLLIATLAPVDRVVTGSGILRPVESTIVVQPYGQAIIRSIDVRTGDIV